MQNHEKAFSDAIRLIFTLKCFFDEEPAYKDIKEHLSNNTLHPRGIEIGQVKTREV